MKTHKQSISNYIFALAILICVLVLLMSFKSTTNTGYSNDEPVTHTVTIFKMKFSPANLTVKKGDKVVWINKDFFPHDVTEESAEKWTSKPFNQGEKWSKVINEDIKYFCKLHKVMKGTITIGK